MSVTLKIIHAGYAKYFERAVSDVERNARGAGAVSGYYTHEGNPPGIWMGNGLSMIGKTQGDIVGKGEFYTFIEQMRHPVTHHLLAPHITMRTGDPRNPRSSSTTLGYDMTLAAPKSFSILWTLADEDTKTRLDQIWQNTLEETLAEYEKNACVGRTGHAGTAQVKLDGFTVAAYTHYTNREGEPHYHTHAVISNLATRSDGQVVALDGRTMVSVRETINIVHAQRLRANLTKALGVHWQLTDSVGVSGSRVWEMSGMPAELLAASSSRRAALTTRQQELVNQYIQAHGVQPTGKALTQIETQAWRETRHKKTEHTINLAESKTKLLENMHTLGIDDTDLFDSVTSDDTRTVTAADLTQSGITSLIKPALIETLLEENPGRSVSQDLSDEQAHETFEHIVAANRTTFTLEHIRATAASLVDGLQFTTLDDQVSVINEVTQWGKDRFISITPTRYTVPDELKNDPRYSMTNALGETVSVLDRKRGREEYASVSLMDAEKNLLEQIDTVHDKPFIDRDTVTRLLDEFNSTATHPLSADQYEAAVNALSTTRQVYGVIGAAGTGKTTTLNAMKYVVGRVLGEGHVVGTAPSTRAAEEMQNSMHITCANIAAIVTENTQHILDSRIAKNLERANNPATSVQTRQELRTQIIADQKELELRSIPSDSVLIVDETGMASTTDLDILCQIAAARNTRVIFTGDPMQLPAVGEGSGALYELTLQGHDHYSELTTLFRFEDAHEADITMMLRDGATNPDGTYKAVDEYRTMQRIHQSSTDGMMLDAAYQDTLADLAAGRDAVLMAADNTTVAHLNEQFTRDLQAQGVVETDSLKRIVFSDNVAYGKGDHIVTRHNQKNLKTSTGESIHNGDHWRITHINSEKHTVSVSHLEDSSKTAELPYWYVTKYAQGGYCSTIHLAQGTTYDTARTLINEGSVVNRPAWYVAMTRGRHENHVYVQLLPLSEPDKLQWENSKRETLEKQGKKLYAYSDTNPDPSTYYTAADLTPTEEERADAYLNHVCVGSPTVLATRSRDQYERQTHSISTLLTERNYLQSLIVADDMTHILSEHHDARYVESLTSNHDWGQLVDAYTKAYAINPAETTRILIERVRGDATITTGDTDALFTSDELDPVNVITRRLNTLTASAIGTSNLGEGGYLVRYTPQYESEKKAGQLNMLHQADQMLHTALNREIVKSAANPDAWMTKIQKNYPTTGLDANSEYRAVMTSVLLYRAANHVTNLYSPLDKRVDAQSNPLRAAWYTNLTNRIYPHANSGHTPAQATVAARVTSLTGDSRKEKEEIVFDSRKYREITTLNRKWYEYVRKTNSKESIEWATSHHMHSSLIAATGGEGSLFTWAKNNNISMEELAGAGLVTQISRSSWVERYPNHVITPIRDMQGRITAFTGQPVSLTETNLTHTTPVNTEAFQRENSLWGMGKTLGMSLTSENPRVLTGTTPDTVGAVTEHLNRGEKIAAIAPLNGQIDQDMFATLREMSRTNTPIEYLITQDGKSDKSKNALWNAFTEMSNEEKVVAKVVRTGESVSHNTVDQIIQDSVPLWQALVDTTLNEQTLTRVNATEIYQELTTHIIDEIPASMRENVDTYIRHNITQQLHDTEQAQHRVQQEETMRQQQVQAQQARQESMSM